jgi:hypothetical protein
MYLIPCFMRMFLISVWLIESTRFSPLLEIYPANTLKGQVEKDGPYSSLRFLVAISSTIFFSISSVILSCLCVCILDIIPSIPCSLNRSMYPFSYVDVMMMVGYPPPYFRNCISFTPKQDNLGTVTRFSILLLLHHFIQSVSFIIRNQSEAGVPHNKDISK